MHLSSTKRIVRILCLSLLLIGSGCGTMVSHFGDCGSTPPAGVYRGTVFDAACMAAPFSGDSQSVGLLPLGVIDFPFSFVADTIIFPFDLADRINRRKRENEKPAQRNQRAAANPDRFDASR